MNKHHYVNLLWSAFIERIRQDWPREYADTFGEHPSLPAANQSFNFATAVLGVARTRARQPVPTELLPTPQTLHNVFQYEGLKPTQKNKTLDFFAAYAGHGNWINFKSYCRMQAQRQEGKVSAEPSLSANLPLHAGSSADQTAAITTPPPSSSGDTPTRSGMRTVAFVLALLVVLLCTGGYLLRQQQFAARMEQLIREAHAAEFAAYSALPHRVDTAFLDKYYTTTSGNRLEIVPILTRSAHLGTRLTKASNSDLIKVEVVERVSPTEVLIRTREKWYLKWLLPDGSVYKTYDKINDQDYLVEYQPESDQWLIRTNAYEGTAQPPE